MTDYLQKDGGIGRYTVLANRITNRVEGYRATRAAARTQRFLKNVLERGTEMIAVVSETGDVVFASGSVKRVLDYTPNELEERGPFALVHEDDRERVMDRFEQRVNDADTPVDLRYSGVYKNGEIIRCRSRGYNLIGDPDINGTVTYTREEEPVTETRD